MARAARERAKGRAARARVKGGAGGSRRAAAEVVAEVAVGAGVTPLSLRISADPASSALPHRSANFRLTAQSSVGREKSAKASGSQRLGRVGG